MTKPIMHFSHGNSYPAGSYTRLLALLADDYDIRTVDRYGHHPDYPVTDGWPKLVDELIARVEGYGQPVILVGHSLGGMLSLMAARRRPELVRCVVMLDSPVVAGWRARLLKLAKRWRLDDRFSPARFSLRRRNVWPSAAAAHEHFAGKEMFAAWAPGVLSDYLEHGLEPHPEGVQLRFSRDVETAIYRALPHHLDTVVKGRFPVPVGFIGGTESVELKQAGLAATRRLVGENFAEIVGAGHLFPMEQPTLAAKLTREMVTRLLRKG